MKPKEFFELVVKMREAQREYFNTRSAAALGKARRLEASIDKEINRVRTIMQECAENEPIQQSLFENTNGNN